MPRYVCCLDGRFFEFSTVLEAPITAMMTPEEFRDYHLEVYGEVKTNDKGVEGLQAKMDRARAFGTSSLLRRSGDTFEQWLEDNTRKTYQGNFPGLNKWKRDYLEWSGEGPIETLRERHNPVDG